MLASFFLLLPFYFLFSLSNFCIKVCIFLASFFLRKWKICIVEWCCLCKSSGESPDFMIFSFLLVWLLPAWFIDLLASWMGGFGKCCSALVWGAIPHCVMWVIWCERNTWVFEGQEVMSIEIKSRFLRSYMSGCL